MLTPPFLHGRPFLGVLEDMAKKYLSLEEAARLLDLTTEQLKKVREQGDIRGFADRGSWKFREQDIEEFLRSRQSDSSPDFPIITAGSSSSVLDEPDAADLSSSDSDVRLFFDESLFSDDESKGLATAGSDVRLSGDSGPGLDEDESDDALDLSGWDSDVKTSDSDSDVKLVGAGTQADSNLGDTTQMAGNSDSDVVMMMPEADSEVNLSPDSGFKISDSDSDVRLSVEEDDSDVQLAEDDGSDDANLASTALFDGDDSDSDVKLMGSDDLLLSHDDSDSDVKLSADLNRTDSDIRLAEPSPVPKSKASPALKKTNQLQFPPDDSDLKLINTGSGVKKNSPGSGLGLDADESGISLEMDSGISLEADDSGISLESYDSGAILRDDSGITLEAFESGTNLGDDSGITLDAGDSGISLDLDDDSGISMQPDDMSRTMPMQAISGAQAALADSTAMTTQFEIPKAAAGHDSEFELAGLDDDDDEVGNNTGVLTFEDDDLDSSRTVAVPALSGAAVQDDVVEYAEDELEDEAASVDDDEFGDEEFEDDSDLDVHDSEEFEDEDFEAGQSQVAGFPTATRTVRADVDWGIGTKLMIGFSAMVSVLCAVVGIELVRTMWMWTQPSDGASASGILQMIGGAF